MRSQNIGVIPAFIICTEQPQKYIYFEQSRSNLLEKNTARKYLKQAFAHALNNQI